MTSTAETGTESYDRSLTSRRYALVGMVCSGVFSCCCIIAGISIMATDKEDGATAAIGVLSSSKLQKDMIVLVLNLIVTICTESTGFVHGISPRSALASESRLRFNPNPRLLTAARGRGNPNGTLHNSIMAVLVIISCSSASLVTLSDDSTFVMRSDQVVYRSNIFGLPVLLLGVTHLLQVVIAWSGIRAVKILTWSSYLSI